MLVIQYINNINFGRINIKINMNNDILWAPWRMKYIKSPKDSKNKCIFCDKVKSNDDENNFIVHRGINSYVLLNIYPCNNGHVMVSPYKHQSKFDLLCDKTQIEMMSSISHLMKIMRKRMNVDGFNFGANFGSAAGAGIEDHLHLHLVPRWNGDTNFMPILGHTKVQVEGLKETYRTLKNDFIKCI